MRRPRTAVVSQGEVGDRLYIVKDGEAEVVARGEDGQEKQLAMLSKKGKERGLRTRSRPYTETTRP